MILSGVIKSIGWGLKYSPEEGTPAAMMNRRFPQISSFKDIIPHGCSKVAVDDEQPRAEGKNWVLTERYDPSIICTGRSEKDAPNVDG